MTMNRIDNKLKEKNTLLSIYFTAGFPELQDTLPVLKELQKAGVDMVEIGLPFSDPLADGPTIQDSSAQALQNGMSTQTLFEQLRGIREHIDIPLILMGYFNPVLQYGVEKFCSQCAETGIDGLIIPDLPPEVYNQEYRQLFEKHGLSNIFLITPQTSEERIRFIDNSSDSFIYMVSSASVTGAKNEFGQTQSEYFQRVAQMQLKAPCIAGFGISNKKTFDQATAYAKGGIIGSAFIKALRANGVEGIADFIKTIR